MAGPPEGSRGAPGGGPYCVFGNGCLGGAPLDTVVGVVNGVAPTAGEVPAATPAAVVAAVTYGVSGTAQ